jgi:hypothetical protein
MFANNQPQTGVSAASMNQAAAMNAPMTLEDVLGLSANNAELLESQTWPAGNYMLQVTGMDATKTYDIKQEGHPFLGQKATRMEMQFTCIDIDAASLKDDKGNAVPAEAAAKFKSKVFKESIMFGNDGLVKRDKVWFVPGPGEEPSRSGFNKLHTIIQRIVGPEAYEMLKSQTQGNTGQMLNAIGNRKFGCSISHSINKDDPNARVQSQLAIMDKFYPVA